jgi:TRAP transporter TAXI family solute receptor
MRSNGYCKNKLLLVILLAAVLLPTTALSAEQPGKLVISGGTAGGAWSAITEGVAEILRKQLPPGSTISTTTGTDAANFMRIEKSTTDMAVGVASTALNAAKGKDPFKSPAKNIRAITSLFDEPFQFVILKKTGIKDFGDIKAKKYRLRHSPNKKGNFMEIACEAVFKNYGFDYKALQGWGGKVFYNSYSESINLLRTDSLDSLSGCSPVPTTHFVELSGTHDISILPLNEKTIEALNKEFGTTRTVIPAGSYKFLEKDTPTIAARNILACKADLPTDLVYKITKAIYEQRDYLGSVHIVMKGVTPQFMASPGGVTLHPGAIKFYKEIGALK